MAIGARSGGYQFFFEDAANQNAQLGTGAFFEVPIDGNVFLELLDQNMGNLT